MRNELLPQYHVTVDIEYEVGFTFMSVTKQARLFVEANMDYKADEFFKLLRKDLLDEGNRLRMVTVNKSPDFDRRHDNSTHRYILRDYGTVGYEKRPYVKDAWGGSFPEVDVTEVASGKARLGMFKAIKAEVNELLKTEHDRLVEAGKVGRFYLWNTETLTAGDEFFDTAEEAHQARRKMPDHDADVTYVKVYEGAEDQ